MFISLCRFPVLSLIRCKLFYAHSRVCNFVIFSYRIQQCVKFVLVKFEIRVISVCGYNEGDGGRGRGRGREKLTAHEGDGGRGGIRVIREPYGET